MEILDVDDVREAEMVSRVHSQCKLWASLIKFAPKCLLSTSGIRNAVFLDESLGRQTPQLDFHLETCEQETFDTWRCIWLFLVAKHYFWQRQGWKVVQANLSKHDNGRLREQDCRSILEVSSFSTKINVQSKHKENNDFERIPDTAVKEYLTRILLQLQQFCPTFNPCFFLFLRHDLNNDWTSVILCWTLTFSSSSSSLCHVYKSVQVLSDDSMSNRSDKLSFGQTVLSLSHETEYGKIACFFCSLAFFFLSSLLCQSSLSVAQLFLETQIDSEFKSSRFARLTSSNSIWILCLSLWKSSVDDSDTQVLLKWVDEEDSPFKGWTKKAVIYYDTQVNPVSFSLGEIIKTKKARKWFNENYTYLCLRFPFIRRITSAIVTIYIPSTLTVIVSWLSFYIDVESPPARVTLGIMPVLTIITQILEVRKILPPINYVTAIDIWLFVCLVFVVMSLCEFALSYSCVTQVSVHDPMSYIIMPLQTQSFGPALFNRMHVMPFDSLLHLFPNMTCHTLYAIL